MIHHNSSPPLRFQVVKYLVAIMILTWKKTFRNGLPSLCYPSFCPIWFTISYKIFGIKLKILSSMNSNFSSVSLRITWYGQTHFIVVVIIFLAFLKSRKKIKFSIKSDLSSVQLLSSSVSLKLFIELVEFTRKIRKSKILTYH